MVGNPRGKGPFLLFALSAGPRDLPPPPCYLFFLRLTWASAVWKPDGGFLEPVCATLIASLQNLPQRG